MRLTRVVIEKFRNLDGLDLDLTGPDGKASPFVAIVGPNASGKTSILTAIAGAVSTPDTTRLVGVYEEGHNVPMGYVRGNVRRRRPGPLLPVLLMPASGMPDLGGGPGKHHRHEDFRDAHDYSVSSRSAGVLTWWIARTLAGDPLNNTWNALAPFLGERRFKDFDPGRLEPRFEDPDGGIHPFSELSSGQRRLVYLFLEIAMVCGRDGILLFDEPEAHLHPAWQLKMRQALMDLLPEGQVIVATHSPFIIDGMPPHQLFVLGEIGPTSWSASA